MKKTLLLLPLLVAGIMQAQIVNVPDANFKALLLSANPNNYTARDADNSFIKIDVNEDGEIQLSETMNVYHLNVTSDVIASYQGVQSFTNLESFYCGGESLMSLDINGLNNLKKINCSNSPLTSVEIGSLTNLEDLAIYSCNLNALNVAGMSSLKRIFCAENSIEVLEVSNLPNLEQLNCSSNLLTELTLSNLPALRDLNFSNNPLETIDLSQVNNLSSLRANDCPLTSLDVTIANFPFSATQRQQYYRTRPKSIRSNVFTSFG
ncbi:leucine-rich repeat domain-containing protein [Flavobacterium sp.]|uniref:leucine-rich repeat domain-containing protein n=1 Tax=Flavobacterium sp. TaxID=239 RepID=UPI0040338E09